MVKLPLYPYQQEGMMHLAFTGRALLADDMGLGKTVQAIAGSELLNRLHNIEKVLVISPASLKSEWLEQIGKFSDREVLTIQGMRKRRYQLYKQPTFFYLANYEQILYDKDYINDELKPELIILDEAQRIKNWQTKTAAAIKQLKSPYAFVLTGTPLENRIDEIYSIVQFLDPGLFGPLFRFNREFHELDKKGLAIGYKNLDRLHERLKPIILRRRRDDVEGELPERSINNYFVQLTQEQEEQYEEHEAVVARLAHLAHSAATGLNLQVARVVVNLDLPWNPAKLEQRIARAWRKHQKHPVSVLNLVSEHTIEHRMLGVLRHKTDLADEVVDGARKITEMKISAGQGSFMERLDELLSEPSPRHSPLQRFTDNVISRHADRLEHLEQRGNAILAIVDKADSALASDMEQGLKEHYGAAVPQLEMLDHATFETLQRLAAAGIIQFNHPPTGCVYDTQSDDNKEEHEKQRRESLSRKHLKAAEEKQRMGHLLAEGGFINEALAPISEALNKALAAAAIAAQIKIDDPISISQIGALQKTSDLPADTVSTTAVLRHESNGLSEQAAKNIMKSASVMMSVIKMKVEGIPIS